MEELLDAHVLSRRPSTGYYKDKAHRRFDSEGARSFQESG